ncbi:MAG: substrate-binding domain-containing protein [Acidimicrobiales bacterium]
MISSSLRRLLALLLALGLVAAACGSDDSDDTSADSSDTTAADAGGGTDSGSADSGTADSGTAGGDIEGEVAVSGSSTVEPISIEVAQDFASVEPNVNVSVTGPGTGDGFKAFCSGETDISDASRHIKDEEAADCESNGIDYVELKVAVDGIAVMTSEGNEALSCLSFPDLYAIVGPESNGFATWADANALDTEVGGSGDLPDAELVISAPGAESGTYDSFVEIVLEGIAEERGQEATTRIDYSSAADDNVIIETVSSNDTSFGWVGFAYADQASGVRMIPVSEEPGGECVEPNAETIASNEYPISRDLFIYVNTAKAEENPAVAAYVDHYMSWGLDEGVANADYVVLTDESKAETRSAWDGR